MAIGGERLGIDLEHVAQLGENHLPEPVAEYLNQHNLIEPLQTSRDYRMDFREQLEEAVDAPEADPKHVDSSEIPGVTY